MLYWLIELSNTVVQRVRKNGRGPCKAAKWRVAALLVDLLLLPQWALNTISRRWEAAIQADVVLAVGSNGQQRSSSKVDQPVAEGKRERQVSAASTVPQRKSTGCNQSFTDFPDCQKAGPRGPSLFVELPAGWTCCRANFRHGSSPMTVATGGALHPSLT